MTPQTVVTGHHFHPPPPLLPPHLRGVASSQHHIRSVGGTTVRQIDPMGGASGYPPSSHAHHLQMMPPYRIVSICLIMYRPLYKDTCCFPK